MAAGMLLPWIAAYSDGSGIYVFPTEVEALRYAVTHGISDVRQMTEWGRVWPALPSSSVAPEPVADPAPAPLDFEAIRALPVGAIITDCDGDTYERDSDGWVRTRTDGTPGHTRLGEGMRSAFQMYQPFTIVSVPETGQKTLWPVGTRVRVAMDGKSVRELAGRTGVVIDPSLRPSIGDGQVLVHIPAYESAVDDRAWSFDPECLIVID